MRESAKTVHVIPTPQGAACSHRSTVDATLSSHVEKERGGGAVSTGFAASFERGDVSERKTVLRNVDTPLETILTPGS